MKLYILGISGTFMSGLAMIAKEAGFEVSGCDANCYPPVSDLLQAKGISWIEGYEVNDTFLAADLVIVGNVMKRGMPVVEAMLAKKKAFMSGPQWLFEHVLVHRRVIAISGTHGKTTTTSMLAHILDQAGLQPGFLIGGVAPNFQTNARLGRGEWFVIEADEYDSAFFDKRPKFMHYYPEIAVLNNLEFDHADIYANLAAIEQQFHYYLRTILPQGVVLTPQSDAALNRVLAKGVYCRVEHMATGERAEWQFTPRVSGGFSISYQGQSSIEVSWPLLGRFNMENGLSAFAASQHAGVTPQVAADALSTFLPVKRRLELKAEVRGVSVYDDFAHHPTAIQKTIEALKTSQRHQRIWVALEPGSYTMQAGVHAHHLADALMQADQVFVWAKPGMEQAWPETVTLCTTVQEMIDALIPQVQSGDAILAMSNKGFDDFHGRVAHAISSRC